MKSEELKERVREHSKVIKVITSEGDPQVKVDWCRDMLDDIEHDPESWEEVNQPYQMTPAQALRSQEQLMGKALDVMLKKRTDYSGSDDPFRNLRSSEFVGVEPWRGTIVRIMDKFSRIRSIMDAGGSMKVDESIEDTLLDVINYTCILAGLIYEELGIEVEDA